MTMTPSAPLTIDLEGQGTVSALLTTPDQPVATHVFAHGAGAGDDLKAVNQLADCFHRRCRAAGSDSYGARFSGLLSERAVGSLESDSSAHAGNRVHDEADRAFLFGCRFY